MTRDQVLSRLPVERREPARHVLEWLLPEDDPVEDLAACDVLQFVWYSLPVKWAVDTDELAAGQRRQLGAGERSAPRSKWTSANWDRA
jgi:hypothetical protein